MEEGRRREDQREKVKEGKMDERTDGRNELSKEGGRKDRSTKGRTTTFLEGRRPEMVLCKDDLFQLMQLRNYFFPKHISTNIFHFIVLKVL